MKALTMQERADEAVAALSDTPDRRIARMNALSKAEMAEGESFFFAERCADRCVVYRVDNSGVHAV